ncbi:hypothetical protein NW759_014993 [Fusarium solani]|nr:hypothetical protein NW759_014993 [Fusarium solani]
MRGFVVIGNRAAKTEMDRVGLYRSFGKLPSDVQGSVPLQKADAGHVFKLHLVTGLDGARQNGRKAKLVLEQSPRVRHRTGREQIYAMVDFTATYVTANLAPNASAYDSARFLSFRDELDKSLLSSSPGYTMGILSAILCAQRRADGVLFLFRDATRDRTDADTARIFLTVRECITLVTPYVGMPACMPAITGLVGEMRQRGIKTTPADLQRPNFQEFDWGALGDDMRETLYGGVGNQEGLAMISEYWPEFSTYAYTAVFGYLYGSRLLSTAECELVVFSSILGQGATRQARIHCKVALKLGNTAEVLQQVVTIAADIANWNNTPLPAIVDVSQCSVELRESLAGRV